MKRIHRISLLLSFIPLCAATGCGYLLGIEEIPYEADADVPDACVDGTWWDCNFAYRMTVRFLNSSGAEGLDNIPIPVKLTPGTVDYTRFAADGRDIRFVADGVALAHEVEAWNSEGDSWIWVQVPRIEALSTATTVHLYHGNPDADDVADPSAVWSDGYEFVYHFAGYSPEGHHLDSGPVGEHGEPHGEGLNQVPGIIGSGLELDGSDDTYIRVGGVGLVPAVDSVPERTLHLETWFQSFDLEQEGHLFHNAGACRGWELYFEPGGAMNGLASNSLDACSDTQNVIATSPVVTPSSWHHASLVVERVTDVDVRVCLTVRSLSAGELVSDVQCAAADDMRNDSTAATRVIVGSNWNYTRTFHGIIDEFRISSVERTPAFLDAQFLASRDRFVALEAPEARPY